MTDAPSPAPSTDRSVTRLIMRQGVATEAVIANKDYSFGIVGANAAACRVRFSVDRRGLDKRYVARPKGVVTMLGSIWRVTAIVYHPSRLVLVRAAAAQ